MNKSELRLLYTTLMDASSIDVCINHLDMFIEYLLKVTIVHHQEPVFSYATRDAKMVNQMMLSKAMHLRKLLEGVGYESIMLNTGINSIVDPTIIASLVRNIYETVCMFHLIYIKTQTKDEREILYYLWVIAGLKFRQRFAKITTQKENQQKHEEEKLNIESLVEKIKKSSLFLQIDEKSQKIILSKIQDKDYKICFEDNKVKPLSWQQISDILTNKHPLFEEMYTYFSLYAHPSNVSVFQFAEMFGKDDEAYKFKTTNNMRYCFALLSIFIADYIKVFPGTQKTFDSLPIELQIMLNAYNKMIRGENFSINDAWKVLN
ncbi:DUF5677 domain-containing protein [Rhodocytophaga aerolata]|uniref:DUF5677 domain-containing protein n=1 Tax=Rhodocytophaga aerolata TaxID=455078 RepID=A0ABT8RG65_9BACT|nr:DUF5677 domain-containing protein [Rhodocytophaga aerolata]MDO1451094.1 DUF5677 domain-containing protein [Rhodocytophaga aerolata]